MDLAWWDHYGAELKTSFAGNCYSHGDRRGVIRIRHSYMRTSSQNSGAGAIALAHHFGAKRVVLLGYDCQKTGGRTHWHGDHPKHRDPRQKLGNAGSLDKWPRQFTELRRHVAGMEIINCSRDTALTLFPRAALEEVL
jgi:hypothetical protein